MADLVIALPEDLMARLAARAAEAGFPDVGTYVASVVRADLGEPANPPRDCAFHTPEQLRARLLEALEDPEPAEPMTAEEWESIRREGRERLATLRRQSAADVS